MKGNINTIERGYIYMSEENGGHQDLMRTKMGVIK
jgi:hypothetical protein